MRGPTNDFRKGYQLKQSLKFSEYNARISNIKSALEIVIFFLPDLLSPEQSKERN